MFPLHQHSEWDIPQVYDLSLRERLFPVFVRRTRDLLSKSTAISPLEISEKV